MNRDIVGKVIRCHTAEGYVDAGRIVHVARSGENLYYIPPAGYRKEKRTDSPTSSRQKSWHISSPRSLRLQELDGAHCDELGGTLSLVDFLPPATWRLTDEELRADVCTNGLVGKRASLANWLGDRDKAKDLIAPIVANYEVADLLEFNALSRVIRERTEELGLKDIRLVRRALLQWLYGCGEKNALLPCREYQGAPGTQRNFVRKPGNPQTDFKDGLKESNGYICTQADRDKLADGWDKYKKKGTSVRTAYLLSCREWWPGNASVTGPDGKVLRLATIDQRPTLQEFRNAARSRGCTGAARINLTDRVHNLCARALRGSARNGVAAVGQIALIDSTPEDLKLVSSLSTLVVLPSSNRTVVIDVLVGYILGLYSGFENPSTLTSLLAILNAASPKVEFCARYGVHITEDEWFSRMPKSIRSDNGELKSRLGMETLNGSGASVEFTASYAAVLKSLVESSHHSLHAKIDHQAPGTTNGRMRGRGETDPRNDACRKFDIHMGMIIRQILHHNNVQPVPSLLTPRMQVEGVKPTRAEIYKWYVKNGYVASAPTDLDVLRARCLPTLIGTIDRNGIRLEDPRDTTNNIPDLLFNSDWLRNSGLCQKSNKSAKERKVKVHICPDRLEFCYFEYQGAFHRLENQARDAESRECSLIEYLNFTDGKKRTVRAMQGGVDESEAAIAIDNRTQNRDSRKQQNAERKAHLEAGGELVAPAKQSLKDNLNQEQEHLRLVALGILPSGSKMVPDGSAVDSENTVEGGRGHDVEPTRGAEKKALDTAAALMAKYRERRRLIE